MLKMLSLLLVTSILISLSNAWDPSDNKPLNPDQIMLQQTGKAIWENKYDILEEMKKEDILTEETIDMLLEYFEEEKLLGSEPEELITCLQCRTFLAALIGFVNQGLTFEDVRDFAIDVCYNVTPALGWNGEIMCEGMIDVFGPHVYWVLNETDKNAEEICQFHRTCPQDETSTTVKKSYSAGHFKAKARDSNIEKKWAERKTNGKKQIIKIAHLTDVHLDEKYTPGAPSQCEGLPVCCRDYLEGTGEAGEWGSYGCALAVPTLHVMLRFLHDLDVDMVINTGDTPNHGLWEETQEGQIRQSEILADGIRVYLPGVPAYLTLGNHDTYPTNQYYGPSPLVQEVLHRLRERYQSMANFTQDEIRTFEHGGYYTKELMPGLRLMAYNSEFGYTDNYYGVLLEESPDWNNMTQWMENTFDLARERNEKILLISHHAQGGGFNFWHDFISDIMSRNGDLVLLHLFGHTHTDNYKMGLDEDGNAFHVNIITASLQTSRNPTVKVFYLDTDTMIPVRFEDYFINISRPVEEGVEPVVELMYSTAEDYLMPDLTPASFQDFTDRMEEDDELFDLYRYNYETQKSVPGPCEEGCRKSFFCDRRTVSREERDACMNAA